MCRKNPISENVILDPADITRLCFDIRMSSAASTVTCANGACGRPLVQPLLLCSKCKVVAYCGKVCQVRDPGPAANSVPLVLAHPHPPRLQTAAWKAGHKRQCSAVLAAAAGLTVQQKGLMTKLQKLVYMNDWRGLVALENDAEALARVLQGVDSESASAIMDRLGIAFRNTGDYKRASELHERDRVRCEALGDRAGVAAACSNLGTCYKCTGDYERAREMHEQAMAISEARGDRAGVARACSNLGNCYFCTEDYAQARELHDQSRAICQALGDRKGVAMACGNLGLCYHCTGDYGRALELHELQRATCEALRDRAGVAMACGNLGICHIGTEDYARATSSLRQEYNIGREIQVEKHQRDAALGMGVALRLQVRNAFQRPAAASELLEPAWSNLSCSGGALREAEKWLYHALDLGHKVADLHLARLFFDAGSTNLALARLREYLSVYVQGARNRCAGCCQQQGEDTKMLTCGGCRVARFCSVEHQRMASDSSAVGRNALHGKHSNVCALLGKWKQRVVKGGCSHDSMREDLVAFLQA